MRSGLDERRECGTFGSFRDIGRLDNQTLQGVGEHKPHYPQNTKSLPAKSNSSKRGLAIRGTEAGDVQVMSAAAGIRHGEYNLAAARCGLRAILPAGPVTRCDGQHSGLVRRWR
jgi:hypothetical protein